MLPFPPDVDIPVGLDCDSPTAAPVSEVGAADAPPLPPPAPVECDPDRAALLPPRDLLLEYDKEQRWVGFADHNKRAAQDSRQVSTTLFNKYDEHITLTNHESHISESSIVIGMDSEGVNRLQHLINLSNFKLPGG